MSLYEVIIKKLEEHKNLKKDCKNCNCNEEIPNLYIFLEELLKHEMYPQPFEQILSMTPNCVLHSIKYLEFVNRIIARDYKFADIYKLYININAYHSYHSQKCKIRIHDRLMDDKYYISLIRTNVGNTGNVENLINLIPENKRSLIVCSEYLKYIDSHNFLPPSFHEYLKGYK